MIFSTTRRAREFCGRGQVVGLGVHLGLERVHRGCGHVTTLRLTCEHCGDAVTARDMTARPAKRYAGMAARSTGGHRMKERA